MTAPPPTSSTRRRMGLSSRLPRWAGCGSGSGSGLSMTIGSRSVGMLMPNLRQRPWMAAPRATRCASESSTRPLNVGAAVAVVGAEAPGNGHRARLARTRDLTPDLVGAGSGQHGAVLADVEGGVRPAGVLAGVDVDGNE